MNSPRIEERLRRYLAERAAEAAPIGMEQRIIRQVLERGRGLSAGRPWPMQVLTAALVIAFAVGLGVALLHARGQAPAGSSSPSPTPVVSVVSNGWIAYSTDGRTPGSTDITTGSDIYLARAGVKPRLIASRDGGKVRNMCPAFSPDGHHLAYGADTGQTQTMVVLKVDANAVISDTVRFAVPGAVCPHWSSDGKRIAYLVGGSVVVRGVDGSTHARVAGDPRLEDFGPTRQYTDPLLSPKGDRIAWLSGGTECQVTVARPDRTAAQVIPLSCGYALPTWSPDGRQILLMQDVSGIDFTMQAIAVDSPFDRVTIVSTVRTNGARSWPGWGDVSWQPILH